MMVKIAIFVILINLMCGVVNTTGVFTTASSNNLENKITESDITKTLNASSESESNFIADTWSSTQYLTGAINLFAKFYQWTFGLPEMFKSSPFDWPDSICNTLLVLQVVIYTAGLFEALRGVNIL